MAFMMDYMGKGWIIGFPFFSLGMMLFWLVIFLIIAYLVYRDANTRGMNGLLWAILVLIPRGGICSGHIHHRPGNLRTKGHAR